MLFERAILQGIVPTDPLHQHCRVFLFLVHVVLENPFERLVTGRVDSLLVIIDGLEFLPKRLASPLKTQILRFDLVGRFEEWHLRFSSIYFIPAFDAAVGPPVAR
jgi:hypothetical protein